MFVRLLSLQFRPLRNREFREISADHHPHREQGIQRDQGDQRGLKIAHCAKQKRSLAVDETPKKEKATITFQEWWSGEKSLTSTAARRVGWENLADWLEDKDKVCTDGQDDGNIGFRLHNLGKEDYVIKKGETFRKKSASV